MRPLAFFIILTLWPSLTSAQEPLSLEDVVTRAIEHSDQIAASIARVDQKRLAAEQAKARPNPEIEFASGRRKVEPKNGPLYEVSLTQPFLYPGKRNLRVAVLEAEARQERVRHEQTRLAVALDVTRLAYEYGIARRKAAFAAERQNHFEVIRSYLSGRTFAAPQKKAESQIVENRLRNLAADGLQAQSAVRAAFETLNLMVGFADTFPDIRLRWFAGESAVDEIAWLTKARAKNPELAEQNAVLMGATKEAALAVLEPMPDFSVSMFTQKARAVETERNRGLGVGVSIPIFNRNVKGIESAKQKARAEEKLLAFQTRRVESGVKRAVAEFESARRLVRQYPESLLVSLHRQVEDAEEEFSKGRVELLVFLELDGEYAETVDHALDAQIELMSKAVELFSLAGEQDFLRWSEKF